MLLISIHAPREGSDVFYIAYEVDIVISIHAPREGSDVIVSDIKFIRCQFQSTLPARGATVNFAMLAIRPDNFNPRSPRGERQHGEVYNIGDIIISIHAPREGSDNRRRV